jgi:hypothetical protein
MNKDAIDEHAVRKAMHLNDLGGERLDAGDLDAALSLYQKAAGIAPYYGPAWYNMGLVHKWRRDWPQSLACNEHAARLITEGLSDDEGDEGSPAWWNLGIAATALRRWDTAREAWRHYGIPIPDGTGELQLDFGPAPVRLDPDSCGEVVWGLRIDPARIVIKNVPTPSSGRHWGDIILHDGAPSGERQVGDQVFGVFDAIEVWQPSGIPTLEVDVTVTDAGDSGALELAFDQAGLAAEDWTASVRMLCKQCSEGSPGNGHHHPPAPYSTGRRFGLAASPEQAGRLLAEWAAARPGTRTYGDPVVSET